jgi:hypothetical protein
MDINTNQIFDAVHQILESIPSHVTLQAAAKGRSVAEIEAVIQAGVTIMFRKLYQSSRNLEIEQTGT